MSVLRFKDDQEAQAAWNEFNSYLTSCGKCHRACQYGPVVSDDKWKARVPNEFQNMALCRECMDEYFEESDYVNSEEFDMILCSGKMEADGVLRLPMEKMLRLDELALKMHPTFKGWNFEEKK